MGELTVSFSIQIEGKSQDVQVTARLCENLNCVRSAGGNRRYFVPIRSNHKFCCTECKDQWSNKTRES